MNALSNRPIDVREYMERWIRWASRGCGVNYRMPSLTGKLMDGMRSTTCPDCKGEGRIPGHKVGSLLAWIDPCPRCLGEKRIKGDLEGNRSVASGPCPYCRKKGEDGKYRSTGEINGRTCHKCKGGKRTVISLEVNPAGIRATRYSGANEDDDPISLSIDGLVAGWAQTDGTYWLHLVTVLEYTKVGTQGQKARYAGEEHGIKGGFSQSWYSKHLDRAHNLIADMLMDRFSL